VVHYNSMEEVDRLIRGLDEVIRAPRDAVPQAQTRHGSGDAA
jgi:hypothetical protein